MHAVRACDPVLDEFFAQIVRDSQCDDWRICELMYPGVNYSTHKTLHEHSQLLREAYCLRRAALLRARVGRLEPESGHDSEASLTVYQWRRHAGTKKSGSVSGSYGIVSLS